jgi:C4-dicarboxylate-specific signal transduction histidine kinase
VSDLAPAERARLLTAKGRLQAAADVLGPLTKVDDRVGRLAAELERKAREAADGIGEMVSLAEVGNRG